MDPTIVQSVQNYGAMAILALMVWRSPQIITAITDLVQNNVKNVRETQQEALSVFRTENDKILGMLGDRFQATESALQALVKGNTEVLGELKNLSKRVGDLERDKPSKGTS